MVFTDTLFNRLALYATASLLDSIPYLSASILLIFTFYPLPIILPLFATIELALFVCFKIELSEIQKHNAPRMTKYQRTTLFSKIFVNQAVESSPPESFIAGWFMHKHSMLQVHRHSLHIIKTDNLREWIAWAFFGETLEGAVLNYSRELEKYLATIQKRCGLLFEEGFNTDITTVRLGYNEVTALHKPFLLYASIYLLESIGSLIYALMGFSHEHTASFSYYHKKCKTTLTSPSRDKLPIVFFHGIGGGLWCYVKLVWKLVRLDYERDLFLVEIPHVSMKMRGGRLIPGMIETVQKVERMLQSHNFPQAHFIGHSLGTVYVAWMVRYSNLVRSSHFIDPIPFKLYEPDVAYRFVHRKPTTAVEFLIYWVISREIYISHYISREFVWWCNVLFPGDLNLKDSRVFIAMNDTLMNSPSIATYLTNHGVHVTTFEDLDHAQFMLVDAVEDRIVREIGAVLSACDGCYRTRGERASCANTSGGDVYVDEAVDVRCDGDGDDEALSGEWGYLTESIIRIY